jgi:protein-tyrosine phosphatase
MTDWQKRTAANLRSQLEVMGKRTMPSGRDGFDDELDSLRALDYKVRCTRDEFFSASLGTNVSKNRYRDVLPNEGTRVVLDPLNDRGDGDYINANYIDARRLFGVPFVYIAAQAPLKHTVFDFWRMVFENNAVFIVMLCAEVEAGKTKSERYWPDGVGESVTLGPLTVELLDENVRNDTIFRRLSLRTARGKERIVHHLQYIRWPDQGIPSSSSGLMEIIHYLGKSPLASQTPIVAHCSGGIGRTGVFLTLHVALALFQMEQPVSVPRIVQFLKYCRTGTVQRKDQYLFAYYAVLREMDKMLWEVESRRHVSEKVLQSFTASRDLPPRRMPEHRPLHPAQAAKPFVRSSFTDEPSREDAYRTRSARGTMFAPSSPSRLDAADSHGYVRRLRSDLTSRIDPESADDVTLALRDLKHANQQRRQTPSRAPHGEMSSFTLRPAANSSARSPLRDPDGSPTMREPSEGDRSAVGLHMATPELFRYSAQPVTPSEVGALSPAATASASRPLPSTLSGADAAVRNRSDVEDEISRFDQSLFGVRRADPTLL